MVGRLRAVARRSNCPWSFGHSRTVLRAYSGASVLGAGAGISRTSTANPPRASRCSSALRRKALKWPSPIAWAAFPSASVAARKSAPSRPLRSNPAACAKPSMPGVSASLPKIRRAMAGCPEWQSLHHRRQQPCQTCTVFVAQTRRGIVSLGRWKASDQRRPMSWMRCSMTAAAWPDPAAAEAVSGPVPCPNQPSAAIYGQTPRGRKEPPPTARSPPSAPARRTPRRCRARRGRWPQRCCRSARWR